MKDIFELLNEAEASYTEQADVKLTKKEQDQIFQMIRLKDKEKYRMKKNIKRATASVAVLAVIISAFVYSPALKTIASNILTYFTGNTKTDYATEVHKNVEQDTGTMELLSVSREDSNLYLRVKFEFKEDVSEITALCGEYMLPGPTLTEDGTLIKEDGTVIAKNCTVNEEGWAVSEDGMAYDMEDAYGNYNGPEGYVLIAPPFINSKIFINGIDYMNMPENEEYDNAELESFPIWSVSARNVEVSGNTLIQDIVLSLQDPNYQEDISISFHYQDIVLSDHIVEGEWNLDYTISNKDYEESELNRMPIELSATDLNGAAYTVESYSVTPGGIKIYVQDDSYDKMTGEVLVRITAYDELGNKYLMYPIYEDYANDREHCTYSIYDGPADVNNEYLDRLDENAKTLTIAFEQLYHEADENGYFIGEEQASLISDELTLNISRAE